MGYVWLDPEKSPGLGAHLHPALGGGIPRHRDREDGVPRV